MVRSECHHPSLEFEIIDKDVIMTDVEDDEGPQLEKNEEIESRETNVTLFKSILLENLRLRKRVCVLSTIMSIEPSEFVLNAACTIQVCVKRFVCVRRKQHEHSKLCLAFAHMRKRCDATKMQCRLDSIRFIQSHIRGHIARLTPIGKAVQRLADMRKNMVELEVLVLKLCSMNTRPLDCRQLAML